MFFVLLLFLSPCVSHADSYPDRWFFATDGIGDDIQMENIIELMNRAHKKNLNGMLWSCGIENYQTFSQERKNRVIKIRDTAEKLNIEIIPTVWTIGYATALGKNPNLMEGIEVQNVPYICLGDKAVWDRSECVEKAQNPDFEQGSNNKFPGYGCLEAGKLAFADSEIVHSGKSSLRVENFTQHSHGVNRFRQPFDVKPHRLYEASFWRKTQELQPEDCFYLEIYAPGSNMLTKFKAPSGKNGSDDWRRFSLMVNSNIYDSLSVYAGVWGGQSGRAWMDDFSFKIAGIVNPIRRAGAPITVKNAQTGEVYSEGKDFAFPEKYRPKTGTPVNKSIEFTIPAGSAIKSGDKLLISCYCSIPMGNGQKSTCMSEPEVYEFFAQSAAVVNETLKPKKWLLSMDEIRFAGTCKACQNRNMSLAQILGDCITKQYNAIKKVNPNAAVYIWNDMLDPALNGKKNYMNCVGDYANAVDYIPKGIVITCWERRHIQESMEYFSQKGFATQAAAYYDVDNLDNCREWLMQCNKTPKCTGIMYTTWRNKYELLEGFADLINTESAPKK